MLLKNLIGPPLSQNLSTSHETIIIYIVYSTQVSIGKYLFKNKNFEQTNELNIEMGPHENNHLSNKKESTKSAQSVEISKTSQT